MSLVDADPMDLTNPLKALTKICKSYRKFIPSVEDGNCLILNVYIGSY